MTIDAILDHVARARASLLPRWKDSPILSSLVEDIAEELQELDDLSVDMVVKRYLSTGEGVALDHYGLILDQAREGRTDEEYRRLLLAKVLAHRGGSTPATIGELAARLFFSEDLGVRYIHNQPAAYQLIVYPAKLDVELHSNNAAAVATEADATTGWTGTNANVTSESGPETPRDGSYFLRVMSTSPSGYASFSFASTLGEVYRVALSARRGNQGTTPRIYDWQGVVTSPDVLVQSVDTWTDFVFFVEATGASIEVRLHSSVAGAVGDLLFVDRVEIAELVDLDPDHVATALKILLLATPAGVNIEQVTEASPGGSFRFGTSTGPQGFNAGGFAGSL